MNPVRWLAKKIRGNAAPAEPAEPAEPPPWDCKRRGCDTGYDRWEPTVTCRVCGTVWTRIGTLAPGQSVEIVATLPASPMIQPEPSVVMGAGDPVPRPRPSVFGFADPGVTSGSQE